MKIIAEKITESPKHALTIKDIKALVEVVPEEWIGQAHVFLLSAQRFENSKWDRPVIQNNTTFRILSRGFGRNEILLELLIELAIRPNRIYPRYAHRLSTSQRKKLEEIVTPWYRKLIAKLDDA